ncbi:hypothetical protein [Bradyrhizobium commune]|uniref:Uncharacterized protein n=1 Tax=Bradyrhizobium commune TaxID=83627 RepID=A0A7S9D9H5_9BRAD|nr:hypothetical protein [Bradyrhizobium commune]QPF93635.1 hypothetical protein IC761_10355 [Bradyrhizobium commune]
MLRRIPAVKWAFTRRRPLPDSGSIDATQIAADGQSVVMPVAEDDSTISVIAESPSAAPSDIQFSDASSRTERLDLDPVVEEASVSSDVGNEPAEGPEHVASRDLSAEFPTDVEPLVMEEIPVSSIDIEAAPAELADVAIDEDASPGVLPNIGPAIVDDSCVAAAAEVSAADDSEVSIDTDQSSRVVAEIEPVVANDPLPVAIALAEDSAAATVEPATVPPPPAPEIRSTRKARARAADPVDRATLIRQRWAETGIRMWNPRLHGAGDATLNIQGRVELLPPAPGETLPRYDKLEFRMLGGQIVCEGVIVEAPAHASQRSFTRLAEPRSHDRVREPMRERQAALA